jgi:hypothetical protein
MDTIPAHIPVHPSTHQKQVNGKTLTVMTLLHKALGSIRDRGQIV